jgi:hypothetical protein
MTKVSLTGFTIMEEKEQPFGKLVTLWLLQMLPSWPLLGLAYGIIRYA